MPSSQLPRISILGLLTLMFYVAVGSLLVHYMGIYACAILYVFAPTVVGVLLSVFEWRRRQEPLQVFHYAVIAIFLVANVASLVLTLGALCCVTIPTVFFWFPQYAIVVSTYE